MPASHTSPLFASSSVPPALFAENRLVEVVAGDAAAEEANPGFGSWGAAELQLEVYEGPGSLTTSGRDDSDKEISERENPCDEMEVDRSIASSSDSGQVKRKTKLLLAGSEIVERDIESALSASSPVPPSASPPLNPLSAEGVLFTSNFQPREGVQKNLSRKCKNCPHKKTCYRSSGMPEREKIVNRVDNARDGDLEEKNDFCERQQGGRCLLRQELTSNPCQQASRRRLVEEAENSEKTQNFSAGEIPQQPENLPGQRTADFMPESEQWEQNTGWGEQQTSVEHSYAGRCCEACDFLENRCATLESQVWWLQEKLTQTQSQLGAQVSSLNESLDKFIGFINERCDYFGEQQTAEKKVVQIISQGLSEHSKQFEILRKREAEKQVQPVVTGKDLEEFQKRLLNRVSQVLGNFERGMSAAPPCAPVPTTRVSVAPAQTEHSPLFAGTTHRTRPHPYSAPPLVVGESNPPEAREIQVQLGPEGGLAQVQKLFLTILPFCAPPVIVKRMYESAWFWVIPHQHHLPCRIFLEALEEQHYKHCEIICENQLLTGICKTGDILQPSGNNTKNTCC
jgi:hypothetical protein